MKIAIFTETYMPDINGVVTHIRILKKGLEILGHQVLIVTADSSSNKNVLDGDILRCPAINTKKLYNYNISSPLSVGRLRIIRKFRPDVVHIHNEFGIGLSGTFISKILKVPYVYTLHTMYDDYIYYVAKKPFIPMAKDASHLYLKLLAKNASVITGPSKKVSEYLKSCGVNKPVNVIANPVELDTFTPEALTPEFSENFYKKYNIDSGTKICCFCGRLGKEKSIDVLLKYWAEKVKKEDNLKLFIFGDGPAKDELNDIKDSLGLQNDVVFTGAINHDELPSYLAICHMYITTSLSEMHSIAMLEAMACGLPVLYIRDENNADQIQDGVNGFIFTNADEMYEKIKYITTLTDDEYSSFRQSVRKSVEKSGAEAMASYMLLLYEEAIQRRKDKNAKES